MSDFIEVFRVEAKSLLKKFRDNESSAVARCTKVFGDKKDLSLMNMQHVVAKEYGFTGWNELAKADDAKLADVFVQTKSRSMHTPFRKFWNGSGSEKQPLSSAKEPRNIDWDNFRVVSPSGYVSDWLLFENADLSGHDLSRLDMMFVSYDERTVFPVERSRLPAGFSPAEFMERRKNAGLGIRQLHKQGLDGKGRAVAVIDGQLLRDHIEYHYNLKGYEEINQPESYATSPLGAPVSALAGKSCGVVPKADVYCFSVNNQGRTQIYYAEALNKVCNLHEQLKAQGKNGIDTVCIVASLLAAPAQTEVGVKEFKAAAERAAKLGIWVNCGTPQFADNLWREAGIHCRADGDVDNQGDYVLMPNEKKYPENVKHLAQKTLCFPAGGRTVAAGGRLNAYQFSAPAFYIKAYECGLFMLARSVKPDLTAEEFWQAGLETGDYHDGIGVYVNPQKMIGALRG